LNRWEILLPCAPRVFPGKAMAHGPGAMRGQIQVLAARARKKKVKREYYDSEEAMRLVRVERRYGDRVRRLSHANLRRYPDILNPNGYKVWGSGVFRADRGDVVNLSV
jgi:hypothetical protein